MVNGFTPIANENAESDSDYHNVLCTSVQSSDRDLVSPSGGECPSPKGEIGFSKRYVPR